jgi:hypothetical protein
MLWLRYVRRKKRLFLETLCDDFNGTPLSCTRMKTFV